jgi:hypothetical protein
VILLVSGELKFQVSDDMIVWIHHVEGKRFFDFCLVLSWVPVDSAILLYGCSSHVLLGW